MQPQTKGLKTGRRIKPGTFLQLQSLHPALRPLIRAYLLGYASSVVPRLYSLILKHLYRRRKASPDPASEKADQPTFLESALRILRTSCELQRFPAFCALLVGGSTFLQAPLRRILSRTPGLRLSETALLRVARWLATFVASWLSLRLLQSKSTSTSRRLSSSQHVQTRNKVAGRTLDLTLFAVTQAVDVIVGELWSRHRARRIAARRWTKAEQLTSNLIDPGCFVASCGLIMWAWFYAPDGLPRAYNNWITSAAQVDLRLVEALRRCKHGQLQYAQETGQAPLLGSMCEDYGLPYGSGDPVKSIPFPCDLVHMKKGSSCEEHAWRRFWKSWTWAMRTYLPLALALQLRKPSKRSPLIAAASACRSSTFLATFITLFYYGVCLGRTRIGPHILGKSVACRNRIDGGVCVGVGCFLCGWSVLIETVSRRKDMALFVAPRAMSTLLPRQYPVEKQWRETLAFAASSAVVITCALENPKRVRGMMGGILNLTMRR